MITCKYMYSLILEYTEKKSQIFSYLCYCTGYNGNIFQCKPQLCLTQDFHWEEQKRRNLDFPSLKSLLGNSHLNLLIKKLIKMEICLN